jgi:predicted PurR-regulated permease PerM
MALDEDLAPAPAAAPPRVIAQLGTPSWRGVVRLVALVAACVAALDLLYQARGVVKLLVIAVFTATALGPVVDSVQRRRVPRMWAILLVYLVGTLSVVAIGALVAPSVTSQVSQLSRDAGHAVADLRANESFRKYDDRYHVTAKVQAQLRKLPGELDRAAGPLRDATVGAIGFVSSAVAVLSIAFLLMLHGDRYVAGAVSVLPPRAADRFRRVGPQVYRAVSSYVVGNFAISLIAGASAWVAMTVLGIPFTVPLAITIGFFDLLPKIGATLGSVIVALVALLVSPLTAIAWLVFSFLYQQVENYLIQPMVYRRAVQVSPLATIVAVLLGGALLGLLGALLAIPAAAAVQLLVQDLRAEKG